MLYSGPAQNRMMRLVWVAATFCILGWLAAYADAGVVDVRVQSSRTETVQVHTPNGYNGEPIPLIVALHGFTQSGPQVERKWNMEQMGNDLNVAWITPTGASRRWCGAGCCGCSSDRDSKFLRAMVEEVIRNPQVNIDESSIFFMGISNGGFMSYRMACEHADLIAGIMPICTCISPTPANRTLYGQSSRREGYVDAEWKCPSRPHMSYLTEPAS